jgi:hypothetical protein
MTTDLNPVLVILAVALLVAIAIAIWMYLQKKRTEGLRSKFGPEYDKTLTTHGDRAHAEAELDKRAKRVEKFEIHPLTREEQTHFAEDWLHEQALFVDDPRAAVKNADALVQEVMKRRGYPVGDFNQNAADLSVDHPLVVENYRIAHDIALLDERGRASTEDLRKAMQSYHVLFDDLLEQPVRRPEEIRK